MDTIQTQGISLPRASASAPSASRVTPRRAAVDESALSLGYRHIDTAAMYGNEEAVGAAIAASAITRTGLHVTTKVWHDQLAPAAIRRANDTSLKKLGLDHVDLYLVHWPSPAMNLPAVFDTLMKLRRKAARAPSASATSPCRCCVESIDNIGAPIACNQIEYHALLDQTPIRNYLAGKSIPVVAYAPLAQGRLAETPELVAIAKKHDATPAQVALKWLLDQDGVAAIPKAQRPASQQSNLDALEIETRQ